MNVFLLMALTGAIGLVATVVLTPIVRVAAIRAGLVRGVQEDRWHSRPTPAVGGVAIFAGFGLAIGVGLTLEPELVRGLDPGAHRAALPILPWQALALGVALAFIVGLVDDVVELRPLPKLVGQVMAASVLVAAGIGLRLTGIVWMDAGVSLLWFVGVTNAVNLLDNMDGVAAGVSGIAAAYLAGIFLLEGQPSLAVFAVGLAAALFGFLAHNVPPARIFMGDSGSLPVGLALAGLALAPAPGGSRSLVAVLAAPVLILGVPLLDTTVVTLGRLLEGRPISRGGRDHTSHRLVELGVPEKRTAWLFWGLAAVGGAVGLVLRATPRGTALLLGGIVVALLALTGAYLLTVRFRGTDRATAPPLVRWLIQSHQRYPVLALTLDAVWVALAYYAAYVLRWSPEELPAQLPYFERSVILFVGVKLIGFILSGVYDMRWASFSLYDGFRVLRANLFGTLLAVGFLFLVEREGLSRGVVAIDFFVCLLLTTGGRLTFRIIEGTTRALTDQGQPVVVLAPADRVAAVVAQLHALEDPKLRPVAAADPDAAPGRSRVGGLPLYGGDGALEQALANSDTAAVLVAGQSGSAMSHLEEYLERYGGVDVYVLHVRVEPLRSLRLA